MIASVLRTRARCAARLVAPMLLAALVAGVVSCGARPAPPSPKPGVTMQASDEDPAPPTPHTVELTLVADAAVTGRVVLRVVQRGHEPVTMVLPDRADQVEWFEPDARGLSGCTVTSPNPTPNELSM